MFNWLGNISFEGWITVKTFALAIISILLAASAARRWQQKNWLLQQRIADQEKINLETKRLFDDFISIASKRHFRSKRLLWALGTGKLEKIEEARKSYDDILFEWNDVEISWNVRFVKNLSNGSHLLSDIDRRIRVPFVVVGAKLENGVRTITNHPNDKIELVAQSERKKIEKSLNQISRAIFEIGRDIYSKLDYLSAQRLDEDQVVRSLLKKHKYNELSILQLFKAIVTSERPDRS